jgi:hydroxymethylglutaryl-CoA lyase
MNWPQIIYSEEAMREVFGIENVNIPLEDKVRLIEAISETGIQRISVGAFVSPKFVPQMASFEKLLTRFNPKEGVSYLTFLHNQKAKKMAEQFSPPLTIEEERCTLFIDICDIHQRRNVNRSIQQIMDSWPDHIQEAKDRGVKTASVAIASAWGSNFMGAFTQDYRLSMLSHEIQLIESMGLKVHDIGLHDSQSFCLPHLMEADITEIKRRWPHIKHFHLHMHNARGMAMPSIYAALKNMDASDTVLIEGTLGGIGGGQYCGNGVASGMVPTEDFIHMLNGMGIPTGIDLQKVIDCVWMLEEIIGRPTMGHVSKAGPRPIEAAGFYDANLPAIETLKAAKHFRHGSKAYENETYSPWNKPITGPYFKTSAF